MIRNTVVMCSVAGLIAACAPLPRPFSAHTESNPLVEDRRVTSSLQIVPVAQYPGLAEAIVRDLAGQDVLATTQDAGPRKVLVTATVESGALVWHAATPDQKDLGTASQALQPGNDIPALAHTATPLIITLLTADGGIADTAGRPRISVHLVHGPKTMQLRALSQAMADALVGRGIVVGNENVIAAIDGEVRVSPSSAGQDVLQIDWIVRDEKGAALGTVSQGSPVDHKILAGSLTDLARDIAIAGAPGLVNVIRQKVPSALGAQ